MVTSDVSFDTDREIVKAKTLNDLNKIKRNHKIFVDYDIELIPIDDLVKSTAVEIVMNLPIAQEIYYKPGILDYIRNLLPRLCLVGLAIFFMANKLIKILILNRMLKYIKVKT